MADRESTGVTRRVRGSGRNPEQRKIVSRRCYLKYREKRLAVQKLRLEKRKVNGVAKAMNRKWRKAARARFQAQGLTIRGTVRKVPIREPVDTFERDQSRLAEANAKQAWQWWLRAKASNWWMRTYYRATGKPWRNSRLSKAAQWRIRYWLDTDFRARELEKVQRLKARRAREIAATDDGTLTGAVIVRMFAEAKVCPYCQQCMPSSKKTLDHMQPLCRGGAHSVTNVVVCCSPCNNTKGRKSWEQWMARVSSQPIDILRFFPETHAGGNSNPASCLAATSP